jgi:hypothetical protein
MRPPPPFPPTPRPADYLPVIHGIVSFWRQYQQPNGSIVDPYALQEIQYSTPCYAFSASLMVTTGFDSSFLDSAALAVDSALSQLANGT